MALIGRYLGYSVKFNISRRPLINTSHAYKLRPRPINYLSKDINFKSNFFLFVLVGNN